MLLHLAAGGIKEPNLKRRAGLVGERLAQFGVIMGDSRASGREGGWTRGANAIPSMTNAAAEIVIAIFLNITNRPVKRPAPAISSVYSAHRPRPK